MASKVYIFNLFNEPAKLSLNGGKAGTINGWNKTSGYAPAYLAVESATHGDQSEGKVYRGGKGENDVRVDWDSGYATGTIIFPTVEQEVSIDQDLVCYIAKNQAFVEVTTGFVEGGNQKLTFNGPT